VTVSLTGQNIMDRAAVVDRLRSALDQLGVRPSRVALTVPDVVAKVSLVRFDRIPARQEDLEQLVRWQLRKSAPFPVEEAVLAVAEGAPIDQGGEFVTVLARRDVIREYESVCEELGMQPGLVDLSTFGVANLLLASGAAPHGDWLVVHVRPEYTSLAIMRRNHMIFFRNLSEADAAALADVAHQTTMYYQDRLAGQGFERVLLGGIGRSPGALEATRSGLAERLGAAIHPIDPTRWAPLADGGTATPELLAILAPLVGTLLRLRAETVGA
jgi:Tfp pilus assembly PilM family ATPase